MNSKKRPDIAGITPPAASFVALVESHALQILLFAGRQASPVTGRTMKNMKLARHNFDLLSVLKEKTRGNLTDEEAEALDKYIDLSRQVLELAESESS